MRMRSYQLALPDEPAKAPTIAMSEMNFGHYPMVTGQSRLQRRFYDEAPALQAVREQFAILHKRMRDLFKEIFDWDHNDPKAMTYLYEVIRSTERMGDMPEFGMLLTADADLANAISGSIIQNSARCRVVFEFSARKVGPNVYTFESARQNASTFN